MYAVGYTFYNFIYIHINQFSLVYIVNSAKYVRIPQRCFPKTVSLNKC